MYNFIMNDPAFFLITMVSLLASTPYLMLKIRQPGTHRSNPKVSYSEIANLEHVCEMLPHIDDLVVKACDSCNPKRPIENPYTKTSISHPLLKHGIATPNEIRKAFQARSYFVGETTPETAFMDLMKDSHERDKHHEHAMCEPLIKLQSYKK